MREFNTYKEFLEAVANGLVVTPAHMTDVFVNIYGNDGYSTPEEVFVMNDTNIVHSECFVKSNYFGIQQANDTGTDETDICNNEDTLTTWINYLVTTDTAVAFMDMLVMLDMGFKAADIYVKLGNSDKDIPWLIQYICNISNQLPTGALDE